MASPCVNKAGCEHWAGRGGRVAPRSVCFRSRCCVLAGVAAVDWLHRPASWASPCSLCVCGAFAMRIWRDGAQLCVPIEAFQDITLLPSIEDFRSRVVGGGAASLVAGPAPATAGCLSAVCSQWVFAPVCPRCMCTSSVRACSSSQYACPVVVLASSECRRQAYVPFCLHSNKYKNRYVVIQSSRASARLLVWLGLRPCWLFTAPGRVVWCVARRPAASACAAVWSRVTVHRGTYAGHVRPASLGAATPRL